MADDPRSPFDDLAAMFPGLDADAASRMIAEVQRLGLDSARMVIERFSQLAGQWPLAGPGPGAGAGPRPPTADEDEGPARGASRPLQADAERAVDAYLNVVRRLYDVAAEVAGGAAPPSGSQAAEPLRLPPAAPGGTTSAYAWLHNTMSVPASTLVPRGAFLVDHQGHQISGNALSFDPAAVARLDPGGSRRLLATLRVPADAQPGTYHGVVLVEHLPDLALHVVAEVHAADAGPADG